jgi:hypothetical protein
MADEDPSTLQEAQPQVPARSSGTFLRVPNGSAQQTRPVRLARKLGPEAKARHH